MSQVLPARDDICMHIKRLYHSEMAMLKRKYGTTNFTPILETMCGVFINAFKLYF